MVRWPAAEGGGGGRGAAGGPASGAGRGGGVAGPPGQVLGVGGLSTHVQTRDRGVRWGRAALVSGRPALSGGGGRVLSLSPSGWWSPGCWGLLFARRLEQPQSSEAAVPRSPGCPQSWPHRQPSGAKGGGGSEERGGGGGAGTGVGTRREPPPRRVCHAPSSPAHAHCAEGQAGLCAAPPLHVPNSDCRCPSERPLKPEVSPGKSAKYRECVLEAN